VAAADFFTGFLTTALAPDELVAEVVVPPLAARAGTAFVEYSRVHGDFALAGAAVAVSARSAVIALLGAGPTPIRAREAEDAVVAGADDEAAVAAAAVADVSPARRALLEHVVREAVATARTRSA
jgi:CO/xanthine dehydrogenase FAD-binding subunit